MRIEPHVAHYREGAARLHMERRHANAHGSHPPLSEDDEQKLREGMNVITTLLTRRCYSEINSDTTTADQPSTSGSEPRSSELG